MERVAKTGLSAAIVGLLIGSICGCHNFGVPAPLGDEVHNPIQTVGVDAPRVIDYYTLHTGYADRFFPPGGGACGYGPALGQMEAAINAFDYASSQACGASIRVYGPGGTVTVRVVDRCDDCKDGDLRLSSAALERIAPQASGWIGLNWHFTESAVGGPMRYRQVPGNAQHGMAVHVSNHLHPLARVEIAEHVPGAQWVLLNRTNDNYFVAPGAMDGGPWDLRIKDVFGQVALEGGITLIPMQEVSGQAQLGPLPEAATPVGVPTLAPGNASQEVSVELVTQSVWPGGMCADLLVRNDSNMEVEWFADVALQGKVDAVYRCEHSISESVLTVFGKLGNQTLEPGMSTDCGFCVANH